MSDRILARIIAGFFWSYPLIGFLTFGHAYAHFRAINLATCQQAGECMLASAIMALVGGGMFWPLYWITWVFS